MVITWTTAPSSDFWYALSASKHERELETCFIHAPSNWNPHDQHFTFITPRFLSLKKTKQPKKG